MKINLAKYNQVNALGYTKDRKGECDYAKYQTNL